MPSHRSDLNSSTREESRLCFCNNFAQTGPEDLPCREGIGCTFSALKFIFCISSSPVLSLWSQQDACCWHGWVQPAGFKSKYEYLGCRWERVICVGYRTDACSNANPRLFFMWSTVQNKGEEHSREREGIQLINSHKMCATYRWEFQRTLWGLDSESQSVKQELGMGVPQSAQKSLPAHGKWDGDFVTCCQPLESATLCWWEAFLSLCCPWGIWLGKQGIHSTLAWVSAPCGHAQIKENAKNEIKLESRYMGAPEAAG